MINSNLIQKAFDTKSIVWERWKAAKPQYFPGQIPQEFVQVNSRAGKKLRTVQADQLCKTTSGIH